MVRALGGAGLRSVGADDVLNHRTGRNLGNEIQISRGINSTALVSTCSGYALLAQGGGGQGLNPYRVVRGARS